jgi:thioredoxin-related protein
MARICAIVALIAISSVSAQSFDDDISNHFVASTEAKAKAAESGKPLVVFITEEWCGACKNLKKQMNGGTAVKALLDKFVVTHGKMPLTIVQLRRVASHNITDCHAYKALWIDASNGHCIS